MNKKVLFDLNYGLYIVTSKNENDFSGCVVNTVTQVTAEEKPKLIVAINKENYTAQLAKKSRKINISVLSEEADMLLIGKFGFRSGRDFSKLEGTEYKMGSNGIPIVTQKAVSCIECNVIQVIDCTTHDLFLLEMQEAEKLAEESKPMTYEYYHTVIKGKTPPKASSYNIQD